MMRLNHSFFALLFASIAIQACDSSKTVTIDKKPVFPGEQVELKDFPSEVTQEVIRIGELNKLESFDPLFASNNGELRILNLVYESLVGLDASGKIVPGLANSWKISPDSMEYEFYLGDKHFHDTDLFLNGLGRKITSADVRFVFERMAKAEVPPQAARLFWSIRGMDSFFQEQHLIYDVKKRSLNTVEGISTPDDKTVIFRLDVKDPQFLYNLAHPYASVYPKESINSKTHPIEKWPIGSDKWKFSGLFRDSIITLRPVNQSTNLTTEIKRKRLEFYFFESEVALYKKFFLDEIDIVPELGPQLSKTILKLDGTMNELYVDKFSLFSSVSTQPYYLFFNPSNRYQVQSIDAKTLVSQSVLASVSQLSSLFDRVQIHHKQNPSSTKLISLDQFAKQNEAKKRLSYSFNSDKVALEILRYFNQGFTTSYEITFINSSVIGRETVFYISNSSKPHFDGELLATVFVKRSSLQKADKSYALFSSEPWWMQLEAK